MTSTEIEPSEIRPLGGYAAKQCPVRLQNDLILSKEMKDDTPAGLELRALYGIEFESRIVEMFKAAQPDQAGPTRSVPGTNSGFNDWVFVELVEGEPRQSSEAPTLQSMENGAPLIVNGRLPTDVEGHRVGEPDLLIRYGDHKIEGSWRYLAVDIKNHKTLDEKNNAGEAPNGDSAPVSSIGEPFYAAKWKCEWPARKSLTNVHDLLQLAHYTAMLETCGHDAPEKVGGILGKERLIVWYDLAAEIHSTRSTSDPKKKTKKRSALDRYDHEFGLRIDVATTATDVAENRLANDSLIVVPRRSSECNECPWRTHCSEILERSHDVSLIGGMRYDMWRKLRTVGVCSIEDLLDAMPVTTARLLEVFEVEALRKLVGKCHDLHRDGDRSAPASVVVPPNAKKQIGVLGELNLSVGDMARISGFDRFWKSGLWTNVLANGSAILGDGLVYRKENAVPECARFDIEIDIDMENNVDDRVYLWGCLVTVVDDAKDPRNGYHPFFDPDVDETTERALFERFWEWFTNTRQVAADEGQTVGAYCWSGKAAENRRMTELSEGNEELAEDVSEFIAGDSWVDLEQSFKNHYLNGRGSGLKKVAPAAGFVWRASDAGGDTSLAYYEKQLPKFKCHYGPLNRRTRIAARKWLLKYNEDDCRATKAIRENFLELVQIIIPTPAGKPNRNPLAGIWQRIRRAARRN